MTREEHRQKLIDLIAALEEKMKTCADNMVPQYAGQYRGALDDLAELEAAEVKVGIQDDLKEKRKARRKAQRST